MTKVAAEIYPHLIDGEHNVFFGTTWCGEHIYLYIRISTNYLTISLVRSTHHAQDSVENLKSQHYRVPKLLVRAHATVATRGRFRKRTRRFVALRGPRTRNGRNEAVPRWAPPGCEEATWTGRAPTRTHARDESRGVCAAS